MAKTIFSGRIIGMNTGHRALIIAVVRQAILDYQDTTHHSSAAKASGAKRWLLTQGDAWLDAVGVNIDRGWWVNWVNNRCPHPSK